MASNNKDVTLGIQLNTAGLKAGTESAAGALAELEQQIKSDTQAIGSMQKALRDLKGGGAANSDQAKKLAADIKRLQSRVSESRAEWIRLGGAFRDGKKGSGNLKSQLDELSKTVKGLPGPFAGIAAGLTKVIDTIAGNPIKTALVGIAGAMVLVTAKTVSAIASLTKYAIAQAEARQAELLRLEGLTKIRNYYGVAAGSARDLQDAIDQTAASSALSRDQIAGLAEQLYRAHFRGEALKEALDAAAIKMSTQGTEQANMWIGYAEAINRTGGNVTKFAQNVKNQLGGLAARQLLGADAQARKLQESYAALTTDIDIGPLQKARAEFNALFSQSTASGRALKQLLSLIIQPVINQITKAIPIAKRFFQGMILAALEFANAVVDVAIAFGVEFGQKVPESLDDSRTALKLGKAAFDALTGAIFATSAMLLIFTIRTTYLTITALPGMLRALWRSLVSIWSQVAGWAAWGAEQLIVLGYLAIIKGMQLVGFFASLLVSVWSQVAAWGAWVVEILIAAAPILLVVAALYLLYDIFKQLGQLWNEIDFKLLGQAIWNGLTAYWENIKAWWTGIGDWMIKTFKSAFKIGSPSRVFEGFGENIGEGLERGLDNSAPDVESSLTDLVTLPAPAANGNATGAGAPAAGLPPVIIQAINLSGYAQPEQAANQFVTQLAVTLRTVGYQLGSAGGSAP